MKHKINARRMYSARVMYMLPVSSIIPADVENYHTRNNKIVR